MINNEINEIVELLHQHIPDFLYVDIDLISQCQKSLSEQECHCSKMISNARKREFIAGRTIAKRLLEKVYITHDIEILRDNYGRPIWPNPYIGSISHKSSICGVLASSENDCTSVGFDIERSEELSPQVWESYASKSEVKQSAQFNLSENSFANVLFSIKESVFKCIASKESAEHWPSLSEILVEITASEDNLFSFRCSHDAWIINGGAVVRSRLTISWCYIIK